MSGPAPLQEVLTLEALAPLEERIEALVVDWAGDGRIDWEDMLERIERYMDIELPGDMTHPVITRIQRIGRQAVREARA